MLTKFFIFIYLWGHSIGAAPTNIACYAKGQLLPVQLFCGERWEELSSLPLIEGRFQTCSSAFQRGVIVFRVNGQEVQIENPELPYEITLDGVEVTCDEIRSFN